jgi:hypothetical protein
MTWQAALAAANLGLTAISAFSSSGGGMGAMLRAQQQMLSLISKQLNDIHKELGSLKVEIEKSRDEMKWLFAMQLPGALINDIAGAAHNYAELLAASHQDTHIWTHEEVKAQIRDLRQRAYGSRARLTELPQGYGPEAALLCPSQAPSR